MDPKTFKLLQEQDWKAIGKELVAFAAWRAWGYQWRHGGNWDLAAGKTVEDLVQDVIVKTIEGVRKWDPDKGELRPWLRAQLRSVMDHLYRSGPHSYETAIPESDDSDADEGLIGNVQYRASTAASLVVMGSSVPEPQEVLLAKEAEEEARKRIERRVNELFQAVSEDRELEEVVEAVLNDCEPKARYLADELGVPVEDIYNRLRRLRRRASKLMKGEDP